MIVVYGVYCDIYKSACNVSSPPHHSIYPTPLFWHIFFTLLKGKKKVYILFSETFVAYITILTKPVDLL
jgi:hypothetical protein